MPRVAGTRFACTGCGRTYRWKPELAGKELRCGCGHVMVAPLAVGDEPSPHVHPNEGLYDLAPESEDAKNRVTTVMRSIPPAAAPAAKTIGYAQSGAAKAHSVADDYFPDRVKDLYMPLALIGGGTVIHVGYAFFFGARGSAGLVGALQRLGLDMVAGTALMLVGVLIASKLRQIDLGRLAVAVVKLCAVSVAPGAVMLLIAPILMLIPVLGWVGLWVIPFVLYFALLGALFDLDQSDTWYCVLVIFLVRLAVYFAMKSLA